MKCLNAFWHIIYFKFCCKLYWNNLPVNIKKNFVLFFRAMIGLVCIQPVYYSDDYAARDVIYGCLHRIMKIYLRNFTCNFYFTYRVVVYCK